LLFYDLNVVKNNNFFEEAGKNNNDVLLIDDFMQAEIFFSNYKEEIKRLLNPSHLINSKTAKLTEELKKDNSVCIHMRRGDFSEVFLVPINYQKQAINLVQKIIPNAKFHIFSDEISLAKEELKDINHISFVSNPSFTALDDFFLMTTCANIIIANSTFSWWAAYLGDDKNLKQRLVISPYIFNKEISMNSALDDNYRFAWRSYIYNGVTPENWISLAYNENPLALMAKNIISDDAHKKIFSDGMEHKQNIYSGDLAPLYLCNNGGDFSKNICYMNDINTKRSTIVTSFYPEIEKNSSSAVEFLLSLPVDLVLFTNEENYEFIKNTRGKLPITIIKKEISDFYHYKYKNRFMIFNKKQSINKPVEQNVLKNERVKLVNEAINLNPYDANYFIWADIEELFNNKNYVNTNFPNTKYIWSGKIALNQAKDFTLRERSDLIAYDSDRTQSHLQIGDITAWRLYDILYDKTLTDLMDEGALLTSELRVLGTMALRYPWLFRLHYANLRFKGDVKNYIFAYYSSANFLTNVQMLN